MRVISKFKDFYDAAQAQGQDRSMVFVRHTSEHPNARKDKGLSPAHRAFTTYCAANSPDSISLSNRGEYLRVEVGFGFVLFAGRLYPYAQVRRLNRTSISWNETVVCYDRAQLAAQMLEVDFDLEKRDKREYHWTSGWGHSTSTAAFFALSGSEALLVTSRMGHY